MLRSLTFAALCLLSLSLAPLVASASPGPLQALLPEVQQRGVATFRYLGLPVYQARLFTPSGKPLDWSRDFAIELTYLRNISAKTLVQSTLQELARTGGPLPIDAALKGCFDAVRSGDRYLALSKGSNAVQFWRNGRPACTLRHPRIKQRFMAIFVGQNTRSRAFSAKLRGD